MDETGQYADESTVSGSELCFVQHFGLEIATNG